MEPASGSQSRSRWRNSRRGIVAGRLGHPWGNPKLCLGRLLGDGRLNMSLQNGNVNRPSISPPQESIDHHDYQDADQRHQQGRSDEIRHDHHQDSSNHRAHGLLLLAVNEISQANRTPQQRSKEKTRGKHSRITLPSKTDFVRSQLREETRPI